MWVYGADGDSAWVDHAGLEGSRCPGGRKNGVRQNAGIRRTYIGETLCIQVRTVFTAWSLRRLKGLFQCFGLQFSPTYSFTLQTIDCVFVKNTMALIDWENGRRGAWSPCPNSRPYSGRFICLIRIEFHILLTSHSKFPFLFFENKIRNSHYF